MQRVVYKVFTNYEKEERWLDKMSAAGWQLVKVGVARYVFEKGEPGKYAYRMEMLDAKTNKAEYLMFLEDAGIEHVTSYGSWIYLRRPSADGPFELFGDIDSKITHYQRLLLLTLPLGCLLTVFVGPYLMALPVDTGSALSVTRFAVSALAMIAGVLVCIRSLLFAGNIARLRKQRLVQE